METVLPIMPVEICTHDFLFLGSDGFQLDQEKKLNEKAWVLMTEHKSQVYWFHVNGILHGRYEVSLKRR